MKETYSKGYRTKQQAINSVKKGMNSSKVKARGFVYGRYGGHIPLNQAKVVAIKWGRGYFPIAKRK